MAVKNVVFKLDFDADGAKKGAKEYESAAGDVDKSNNKVSAGFKKVGAAMAAAFAGGAILAGLKNLKDHALALESVQRKADIVFGSYSKQIQKFAKDNAAAFGLSSQQAIRAAASIGDLLIPMGFTRKEAAAMSQDLLSLSGALSEWSGGQVTATEVGEILAKAMLGEREQLKSLGIAISEADVQARLAEKGQEKLTGAMLAQAKAAATQELIFEKSADAQAAFASNSESLTRSQAELDSHLQSIADTLATVMLPAFTSIVGAVGGWADGLADLVTAQDTEVRKLEETEDALQRQLIATELTTEGSEDRRVAIDKLVTLYPHLRTEIEKIIESTDIETASNTELRKAVSLVNDELAKNIVLARKRVELDEQQEDIADAIEARESSREKVINLLKLAQDEYGITLSDTNNIQEKAADAIEKLGAQGQKTLLVIRLIEAQMKFLNFETGQVSKEQQLLNDLNAEYVELQSRLFPNGQKVVEITEETAEATEKLTTVTKEAKEAQEIFGQEASDSIIDLKGLKAAMEDVTSQYSLLKGEIETGGLGFDPASEVGKRIVDNSAFLGEESGKKFIENYGETISSGLGTGGEVLEAFNQFSEVRTENELKQLEREKEAAIEAAQERGESTRAIEIQFDKEKEKIEKAAFERNKRLQIALALISGAQAIISTLAANPGVADIATFGGLRIASVAAVIAATAAQVATISAAQFAEGAIDINGPGTETSDSIPARLSKGESVISARNTRKYKPILQAIHEGRAPADIVNALAGPGAFTDAGIIRSTDKQTRALSRKLDDNNKLLKRHLRGPSLSGYNRRRLFSR